MESNTNYSFDFCAFESVLNLDDCLICSWWFFLVWKMQVN